jgi:hypothetical protein
MVNVCIRGADIARQVDQRVLLANVQIGLIGVCVSSAIAWTNHVSLRSMKLTRSRMRIQDCIYGYPVEWPETQGLARDAARNEVRNANLFGG